MLNFHNIDGMTGKVNASFMETHARDQACAELLLCPPQKGALINGRGANAIPRNGITVE